MTTEIENPDINQKLAILKEECPSVGLANLAMILYKGFTDKIDAGYPLAFHDIRYIEEMWELRQKK